MNGDYNIPEVRGGPELLAQLLVWYTICGRKRHMKNDVKCKKLNLPLSTIRTSSAIMTFRHANSSSGLMLIRCNSRYVVPA